MKRYFGAVLATLFVLGYAASARAADDKKATAILDKAIKALGGEEKLSKIKAAAWKYKGTITFNGEDNKFTSMATMQGLDHLRSEFNGEFGGNNIKVLLVLAKNKGWRQFSDMKMELDENALANEKRNMYLQVLPMLLVPLKDKSFKVEAAGEKKVGDKPAVGLKVKASDGKDLTLFFDKESGLLLQQVAKVVGFTGEEYTQETTFADYKEIGGIKKATKITSKRDGEKFLESEITEFKVLDTVDPKTFEEPK